MSTQSHMSISKMEIISKALSNNLYRNLTALLIAILLIPYGSLAQKSGEDLYKQNCAVCHRTDEVRMVGPGLKGINEKRSQEWLIRWIKNSQEMIASGDADAIAIFEEYNKTPMIAYNMFSDAEIISILEYIDIASQESADLATTAESETVTETTPAPSREMQLYDYVLLGLLAVLVAFLIWMIFLIRKLSREIGYTPEIMEKRHGLVLILMLLAAGLAVYLLKVGIESGTGMISILMFIVFPYVSILIFLFGSIIRYRATGFKVSSLSSQFLEGKKLFWGSQPFHLGLLVLFFGHLTAFLFPQSILAWNGSPVRLLILEGSAFVFALSTLFGLIMLIRRRMTSSKLLVISNYMDMLVYTVLIVQILSGMGVAFYVRWGSSWFASVLTPYLRSIFTLNPQIDAVSVLPWIVQIHIFSAFFIVGLIPFTRFMHFLVAPIDYLWRSYQVVMWNWNRKLIRTSSRHTFGRKTNNH